MATNTVSLRCPNQDCRCILIKAGRAAFTDLGGDYAPRTISTDAATDHASCTLPTDTEEGHAPRTTPADTAIVLPRMSSRAGSPVFEAIRQAWAVDDMYAFENIGFSKAPPPSSRPRPEGDFRYLCCAACDAGPLGYGLLAASPPVFRLAADRVASQQ